MILTICLPTYNRVNDLIYNLRILKEIIDSNNLFEDVSIIISNNCSPDNTQEILSQELQSYKKIQISVFQQNINIGCEKNIVFTIEKAQTDFCMLLGDDDYLNEGYILGVLAAIKENKALTCIFPAYQAIYPNKEMIKGLGRDLKCKTKLYTKGFMNCVHNYPRAHQLSGLTFRKEELVELYHKKGMNNLYPQVFFMMKCCLNGVALHITDYPVLVTHVDQTAKDWNYGKDGLLIDKFQNGINLDLSYLKATILEIITIIDTKYLLRDLGFKVIPTVVFHKNTKILAGFFLPFFILYTMIEKFAKKIYWKISKKEKR